MAIIMNSEGWKYRRRDCVNTRAPKSQQFKNLGCFFSIMRDGISRNFSTKEVKFGFRKICEEFTKRIDPDLPFSYNTFTHTHFYEGPLPDFKEPSDKPCHKIEEYPEVNNLLDLLLDVQQCQSGEA